MSNLKPPADEPASAEEISATNELLERFNLLGRLEKEMDINDELMRLIEEVRSAYEGLIVSFAADGYRPAAKVMLKLHIAKSDRSRRKKGAQ